MSDPKMDSLEQRVMNAMLGGFKEIVHGVVERDTATNARIDALTAEVQLANRNATQALQVAAQSQQAAAQAMEVTRRVFRNLAQPARAKLVHDMCQTQPVKQVAAELAISPSTAYRHNTQHKARNGK